MNNHIETSHASDEVFDLIVGHWYKLRDGRIAKYEAYWTGRDSDTENNIRRCDFEGPGGEGIVLHCTGRRNGCPWGELKADVIAYLGVNCGR